MGTKQTRATRKRRAKRRLLEPSDGQWPMTAAQERCTECPSYAMRHGHMHGKRHRQHTVTVLVQRAGQKGKHAANRHAAKQRLPDSSPRGARAPKNASLASNIRCDTAIMIWQVDYVKERTRRLYGQTLLRRATTAVWVHPAERLGGWTRRYSLMHGTLGAVIVWHVARHKQGTACSTQVRVLACACMRCASTYVKEPSKTA